MTIKEFFRIKANLAIHCDTEEKAKKLLEAFDKAGHRWKSGGSYKDIAWEIYKEETCYSNDRSYGRVKYFKQCGYTIIEFDEIEFGDASFKACVEKIQSITDKDELRRAVYHIDSALSALRKAQYARFQTEDCSKKQNTTISVDNDEATVIAWGLERYIKEYAAGEDD